MTFELAQQIGRIVDDHASVQVTNGSLELTKSNVMRVVVEAVPTGVTVINMRKIGRLSGIRNGRWLKTCDYLLVSRVADGNQAIFVELKKTLAGRKQANEQLRRSLPYLDFIRSVCRIEFGAPSSATRVMPRYVLIGEKVSPLLAKQSVSRGPFVGDLRHCDIRVTQLVGTRFPFSWLRGS